MPTRVAIASSQLEDVQEAALQAATSIQEQLDDNPPQVAILFACAPYGKPETLAVIKSVLRPERLIGASVNGIILSEQISRRGIGIVAIRSQEMAFGIASGRLLPADDPRTVGFSWARQMSADCRVHQHRMCLMFTDPRIHNTAQFIRGAQEVLGFGVPIIGAVTNSDAKTQKNFQFFQGQVLTQSAAGLLIGGAHLALGSKHGFKPLGKPRAITASEKNIIHTIDGKPASHIYEEYLGIKASPLEKEAFLSQSSLYPIGIYLEQAGQYLLKNAIDILDDGSIVCQGEVPQGAEMHLMIGNRDSCKQSAIEAATQVRDALEGRPARLIMIIESAVRQKILKNNSFLEIQAIKEVLGHSAPMIGIYGFGEMMTLAPGHEISGLQIQNESILIAAIS